MSARNTWRSGTGTFVTAAAVGLGALVAIWLTAANATAQRPAGAGGLVGTVSADRGEVRGLRVKAKDTVNRVAYTVFTTKGRYQILNLPPSSLRNPGLGRRLRVADAEGGRARRRSADRQSRHQGEERDGRRRRRLARVDRADELWPYGRRSAGCGPGRAGGFRHAVSAQPRARADGEELLSVPRDFRLAWARDEPDGLDARRQPHVRSGRPRREHGDGRSAAHLQQGVAGAERDDHRLPGRELRTGIEAARPENRSAAAGTRRCSGAAMYVQYELKRDLNRKFANGLAPAAGGHSAFASLDSPGVVWISGNSSNSIVRVDTRDQNFTTRTREYWVDNPGNINTTPHGIIERGGARLVRRTVRRPHQRARPEDRQDPAIQDPDRRRRAAFGLARFEGQFLVHAFCRGRQDRALRSRRPSK